VTVTKPELALTVTTAGSSCSPAVMDVLQSTILAEAVARAGPENAGLVDVVPGTCSEVSIVTVL
jgi:hypothetical protein